MLTEAERLRRKETRQRNEAAKKERRERESDTFTYRKKTV